MIQPRKAVAIAAANLRRQVRDRTDLFFVFVLPTIIVLALGLQFGGPQQARIGVVTSGPGTEARELVALLEADELDLEIREIPSVADLRAQVERGMLEAGVVVPDGFGSAAEAGGTDEVVFIGTTDSLTLGLRTPVEAAVARLAAQATAARVATAEGAGAWSPALDAARDGYADVPGVEVTVATAGEPGLFAGFTQFAFGASTQLVMFMFLTSMTAAGKLVYSKQLGVSRRMVSTPTSVGTIVTGEALGRLGVALLQAGYIVLVTWLAFGVDWGDPLAAGALIVAFGVVCAGAAMLVGALAGNAEQAGSLGVFAGLALGALGGCMIPIQTMPDVMQTITKAIPHSWALLGLQELIRTGGGLGAVLVNLAVLVAFGVVLMVLASWRFRKTIAG
jgi:ABC-2 type transport system permease protein